MRTALVVTLAAAAWLAGCVAEPSARNVVKTETGGYESVPGLRVSPEEALRLAGPHLDRSFALRSERRPEKDRSNREPTDHIFVKGDWYYVARDNYPAINIDFYLPHAVKVHGQTGQVVPPE